MKQEPKAGAAGDVEYITGPAIERRQDWTSSSVSSPADAGGLTPDPKLQVSGNVCEIGQLQDESEAHGIVIQRDSGEFVTIKGLAIEEVKALGPCFMDDITISFGGASPAPSAKQEPNRDVQQLANWLLVDPENGEALTFAGPLESFGIGLGQVKMMSLSGNVWTLVADLREGYKTEVERNANLLRIVKEELADASASPAAPGLDRLPWYCPHCQAGVPSKNVTFEEYHDPRAGGCGYRVGEWPAAPVAGSQQVPEGYAIVPVDPTPEMLKAANANENCGYGSEHFRRAYVAMLAAAPSVPVPVEQDQTQSEWIDAEQRLPDDDCRVLAATWTTMTNERHIDVVSFRAGLGQFSEYSVTHWMPLPAAPSLQQGKEGALS